MEGREAGNWDGAQFPLRGKNEEEKEGKEHFHFRFLQRGEIGKTKG